MNDKSRKAMFAKKFSGVERYAEKHDFNKPLNVEIIERDINHPDRPRSTELNFQDLKMVKEHGELLKKYGDTNLGYTVGGKPFPLERRQSMPIDYVRKAKSIGLELDEFGIPKRTKHNAKVLDMYDQNYVLTRHKGELKKQ